MGDLPEAGKFLFLSGIRKPEYWQAIGVVLRKHGKNKAHDLFRTFPHKARLVTLSECPDTLAQQLREFGFPEVLKDENEKVVLPAETGRDAAAWITCLAIALAVCASISLGIIKLKEIAF
jgi:hypothetical protein